LAGSGPSAGEGAGEGLDAGHFPGLGAELLAGEELEDEVDGLGVDLRVAGEQERAGLVLRAHLGQQFAADRRGNVPLDHRQLDLRGRELGAVAQHVGGELRRQRGGEFRDLRVFLGDRSREGCDLARVVGGGHGLGLEGVAVGHQSRHYDVAVVVHLVGVAEAHALAGRGQAFGAEFHVSTSGKSGGGGQVKHDGNLLGRAAGRGEEVLLSGHDGDRGDGGVADRLPVLVPQAVLEVGVDPDADPVAQADVARVLPEELMEFHQAVAAELHPDDVAERGVGGFPVVLDDRHIDLVRLHARECVDELRLAGAVDGELESLGGVDVLADGERVAPVVEALEPVAGGGEAAAQGHRRVVRRLGGGEVVEGGRERRHGVRPQARSGRGAERTLVHRHPVQRFQRRLRVSLAGEDLVAVGVLHHPHRRAVDPEGLAGAEAVGGHGGLRAAFGGRREVVVDGGHEPRLWVVAGAGGVEGLADLALCETVGNLEVPIPHRVHGVLAIGMLAGAGDAEEGLGFRPTLEVRLHLAGELVTEHECGLLPAGAFQLRFVVRGVAAAHALVVLHELAVQGRASETTAAAHRVLDEDRVRVDRDPMA
jgi:hypothetical protein